MARLTLLGGALISAFANAALAQDLVITEQLERAAFRAADLDGNGLIDEAELASDAITAFIDLDPDLNGAIGPEELVGVSEATFARADFNGNGVISLDEIRLRKLEAFNAADRDFDGQVSMAEMLFRTRRAQ